MIGTDFSTVDVVKNPLKGYTYISIETDTVTMKILQLQVEYFNFYCYFPMKKKNLKLTTCIQGVVFFSTTKKFTKTKYSTITDRTIVNTYQMRSFIHFILQFYLTHDRYAIKKRKKYYRMIGGIYLSNYEFVTTFVYEDIQQKILIFSERPFGLLVVLKGG